MPSLVFLAGPIAGRRYKLGDGEYVIGRRSDCQIFVPDMRVSRQHARLWKDGDGWTLEDLGSNNGTYVNGTRLQGSTGLRHADEIMIANNKIRVEAQDELFPQAEDVGMLTEDERTGELRVQVQRHRERITGAQPPLTRAPTSPATAPPGDKKKTFGGELRVPGTIIQHVVSDKRGV